MQVSIYYTILQYENMIYNITHSKYDTIARVSSSRMTYIILLLIHHKLRT